MWTLELIGFVAAVLMGIVIGYMRGPWLSLGLSILSGTVFILAWLFFYIAVVLFGYITLPLLGISHWDRSVNSKIDLFAIHIGGSLVALLAAFATSMSFKPKKR